MIVLHDGNGLVVGLQTFPETSDSPHIVVGDDYFEILQPFLGEGLYLIKTGDDYSLPIDIDTQLQSSLLKQVRVKKLNDIEQMQAVDLTAGVPFVFGSAEDIVQTRGERDLININGVVTQAILLKNAGVVEPIIQFRAQSNATYMLTPDEAINMGVTVAQHSQQVYEKAWLLKDAINAAQTIEELELVQW
jgi:hypothetical protein